MGHGAVTSVHLAHNPFERVNGFGWLGYNRGEQVGNTIVNGEFEHLGVDHDQPAFIRGKPVEQGEDHGVDPNRLTRAGGASHQQVGHPCQIAEHGFARNVLAKGKGELARILAPCGLVEQLGQVNRLTRLVGNFYPHNIPARNGGNAHTQDRQGARHIICQPDNTGRTNARSGFQLVECDHWSCAHAHNFSLHAVVGQNLLQHAGRGVQQFGRGAVMGIAGGRAQQAHGWEFPPTLAGGGGGAFGAAARAFSMAGTREQTAQQAAFGGFVRGCYRCGAGWQGKGCGFGSVGGSRGYGVGLPVPFLRYGACYGVTCLVLCCVEDQRRTGGRSGGGRVVVLGFVHLIFKKSGGGERTAIERVCGRLFGRGGIGCLFGALRVRFVAGVVAHKTGAQFARQPHDTNKSAPQGQPFLAPQAGPERKEQPRQQSPQKPDDHSPRRANGCHTSRDGSLGNGVPNASTNACLCWPLHIRECGKQQGNGGQQCARDGEQAKNGPNPQAKNHSCFVAKQTVAHKPPAPCDKNKNRHNGTQPDSL